MRCILITALVLTAAGWASADIVLNNADPGAEAGWRPSSMREFGPTEVDRRLTVLGVENDTDFDGFVDGGVCQDANPLGYVVFNPFSRFLNVRVSLGHMLDAGPSAPLAVDQPPAPEPIHTSYNPPPQHNVPEPTTIALLAVGAALISRRVRLGKLGQASLA